MPSVCRGCGAGRASARCWTGCSRTCARATVRCSSSGGIRASASRRCCVTPLRGPPVSGSRRSRASNRRWSWHTRDCTSCARRCLTSSTSSPSRNRSRSARCWVCRPARLLTASSWRWRRSASGPVRALHGEADAAEDEYRASIAHLGRTRLRMELARGHLLYGEWLRREGATRTARDGRVRAQASRRHP